jgi:hypothetical protein
MLNTVSSISDFITFIYILLQRFSSALLCCCPSLRKTKTDENLSHLDKAIIWAREQPVSWITLCRYVLIGIQVAIEGIISVFETDNLYKRIAIVLNSSGQRVRTFKSLQKYGIILRFGRLLNTIQELVMAEIIETFPDLFDVLENEAEGDDIIERIHSIQVAVIAEIVGPRLTALDHAVVNVFVSILCIFCAVGLFIAIYFPTDILVSRWLGKALGLLTDENTTTPALEDGTSVYRILIYCILVFFGSIFFVVISSMLLINVLLSACKDIMFDLKPDNVEKIMGAYQVKNNSGVKQDRTKNKFGRTNESLNAENDTTGTLTHKQSTPFRSFFTEHVNWMPTAEPSDMKNWWTQLEIDVDHCREELLGFSTALLQLLNLGASLLVSLLIIAFAITEPTLKRIVIGILLFSSIVFGYLVGHFTSNSRSYGIIVLSEAARHIDAVFDTDKLYKRGEGGVSACVGVCCYCFIPKSQVKMISLEEWNMKHPKGLEDVRLVINNPISVSGVVVGRSNRQDANGNKK